MNRFNGRRCQMLNLQELRALESITNTTFGRSSMRDAGHAIAYKLMKKERQE